jgi:hypothetical protein
MKVGAVCKCEEFTEGVGALELMAPLGLAETLGMGVGFRFEERVERESRRAIVLAEISVR